MEPPKIISKPSEPKTLVKKPGKAVKPVEQKLEVKETPKKSLPEESKVTKVAADSKLYMKTGSQPSAFVKESITIDSQLRKYKNLRS